MKMILLLGILRSFLLAVKYRARALSYTWATIIGTMIASRGLPPAIPTLGVIVGMSATAFSVYIFNEVMDYNTDRINNVDRPIAQGKIPLRDASIFAYTLAIVGSVVSFLVNIQTFLVCLAFLVLGFAYSMPPIHLKSRFMLKQTTVAIGAFLSSIAGGAAVGIMSWNVIFAGVVFMTFGFAMSPVLDIGDIEGDSASGRKTLPLTFGSLNTIKTALVFMVLMVALSIIGFLRLGFNVTLPILISLLSIVCGATLYPLLRRWQDSNFIRLQVKKWVVINFMIQLSLIVGALPLHIP